MSYNYLFKLIIIGDASVGKTALIKRLLSEGYNGLYEPTIGVDFATTTITLENGVVVKSHMWDTAGQESFAPIIKSYYKGTAGAILVFDVSNEESFERLDYWLKQLENNKDHANPLPIVLVGNKIDMTNRTVSRITAQRYANKKGLMYVETSALQGININKFYRTLIVNIYNNMDTRGGVGIKKNSYLEPPPSPKHRMCSGVGDVNGCCVLC